MRRMHRWLAPLMLAVVVACQPQAEADAEAQATEEQPGTPESKIENATAAAPASISDDATVMDWPATEGGEPTELRAGTNGWTCMPDNPAIAGNDAMCLDGPWLAWGQAYMSKTEPSVEGLGISYMLTSSAEGSNTDPFATAETADNEWHKNGPHIMLLVPDASLLEGLPTDAHNGGPYVMWKGTPYVHVMVPTTEPIM
ncbi:MAG: hypothetical protein ACRELD_11835 [Longimicrobiales bacterium]